MQPLEFVVLAVAGALGALVTVVALGASFLLVLPIAVLVAGIGYAISQSTDDEDGVEDGGRRGEGRMGGRGFDDAIGGH
jgi:membrane protein implicated in regulation of membrane protease activity